MFGVQWKKIYTKKSAALQFLFNCSLLFFYFRVFVVVMVTQTRYKRYHSLPRKKSWNKMISFKKLPRIWWKRRMQSRYLLIDLLIDRSIGWNLTFKITERILERWLVESYGLWNYRPWKWRNMSRSAGCFVRRKLRINVIVKTKSTTIFHMVYTLIDHRNDAIKCSKLCSETTRQRLVVPLEFWTFYVVISMVHDSVGHGKLPPIC